MITRRRFLATSATLPFLLVACGDDASSSDDPPEISLGRDSCDSCGMIISEERFARGIVDTNGDALLFDDAGEMVAVIQEEGLGDRRAWVHGFPSKEWMNASDAWYAVTMELPTPMGSGVFPFDTQGEAEAFAREQSGKIFSWDDLLENWAFDAMMGMGGD